MNIEVHIGANDLDLFGRLTQGPAGFGGAPGIFQ